MEPTWHQNGAKWSQNGSTFRKKSIQKSNATKKRADSHSGPPFEPKKWPTWPQVGFQNRSKIDKKSMQKSIGKLMHLGIDFWKDFGGFLERKWRHVGIKIDEKSMQNAKSDFLINRALAAAGA